MPWKVKDVEKFKKGLNDKQKEKWVSVANGELKQCKAKGGEVLDCEMKAIKVANATLSDNPDKGINFSTPFTDRDHNTPLCFVVAAEADEDEYQLALPIGLFHLGMYGEFIVTKTFADKLASNWKFFKDLGQNIFMDTEHDFGEANAWAEDVKVDEDGLKVKWEFTELGQERIDKQLFKYYSAALGWHLDINSGEEIFPVMRAVSLTNKPAMYTMPEAHLSNNVTNSAHGDGEKNKEEVTEMTTLLAVMTALLALSDEEKAKATDEDRKKIVELFGLTLADDSMEIMLSDAKKKMDLQDEKIKILLDENKDFSTKLEDLKKKELDTRKTEVIEKALSEGKILPKNKEKWEGLFEKDPEGTEALLTEKGKEADFSEAGSDTGGVESTLTAEEIQELKEKFHFSDEDIKEYEKEHGGEK